MASARIRLTPALCAAACVPSPQSSSRPWPPQAAKAAERARSGSGMVAAVPSSVMVSIKSFSLQKVFSKILLYHTAARCTISAFGA